jgi:hypothetical protein
MPNSPTNCRASRSPKKIEQEALGHCHYSEYLTLLSSLQDATTRDRQACFEKDVREVVDSPPKMINEKELYGC